MINLNDVTFREISFDDFKRIWDSDFKDAYPDSHPLPFDKTPKSEWGPIWERQQKVMQAIYLKDEGIGYIFISPKQNQTAHIGYGLFSAYRGKGLSAPIVKYFLSVNIPLLATVIKTLIGTAWIENKTSQKVLTKLGFTLQREYNDFIEANNAQITYCEYIKAI